MTGENTSAEKRHDPEEPETTRQPLSANRGDGWDVMTDGGTETELGAESPSLFKINILQAIARSDATPGPKGLAIKATLEDWAGEDINHARLYPNLDRLVVEGLVEKRRGVPDDRSNAYLLTDAGREVLRSRWRMLTESVQAARGKNGVDWSISALDREHESDGEPVSDGGQQYLVAGGARQRTADRRLHTDADCRMLQQAANPRPASAQEIREHEVCRYCAGEWEANDGGDWSFYEAAKNADPDLMTDGGTMNVCPECGESSPLVVRSSRPSPRATIGDPEDDWACSACGISFDEPDQAPARQSVGRRGLAGALQQIGQDDDRELLPDGGQPSGAHTEPQEIASKVTGESTTRAADPDSDGTLRDRVDARLPPALSRYVYDVVEEAELYQSDSELLREALREHRRRHGGGS